MCKIPLDRRRIGESICLLCYFVYFYLCGSNLVATFAESEPLILRSPCKLRGPRKYCKTTSEMIKHVLAYSPILIFILIVSWIIAISLEHFSGHHNLPTVSNIWTKRKNVWRQHLKNDNSLQMTDEYKNVFTFIQVSRKTIF